MRSCEFSFETPRGSRPGDEIPHTFCVTPCDSRRSLSVVERAEVSYRITALWEPSNMSETGMLEVPILFPPDTVFQSMDSSNIAPALWLEMPLTPERCGPFHRIVARRRGTHVYCLTNRIFHNKTSMCCTSPRNRRRCQHCCFPGL